MLMWKWQTLCMAGQCRNTSLPCHWCTSHHGSSSSSSRSRAKTAVCCVPLSPPASVSHRARESAHVMHVLHGMVRMTCYTSSVELPPPWHSLGRSVQLSVASAQRRPAAAAQWQQRWQTGCGLCGISLSSSSQAVGMPLLDATLSSEHGKQAHRRHSLSGSDRHCIQLRATPQATHEQHKTVTALQPSACCV